MDDKTLSVADKGDEEYISGEDMREMDEEMAELDSRVEAKMAALGIDTKSLSAE